MTETNAQPAALTALENELFSARMADIPIQFTAERLVEIAGRAEILLKSEPFASSPELRDKLRGVRRKALIANAFLPT
jgi:hypothetical protein